ncbi:CoA-binding protein [Aquibacillus salsiterrae]|uniref:CoA-binding protein n=1 Tax=Aquibacillus salsiterrae TaxID=2950439 RepID=A0A9X3WBM6_9BACI|nr:CoA-binding protein [Aquibacillus salsiterrae]MDC3416277.1 CoA-binding protein [Aquibacillus salsiterrae]
MENPSRSQLKHILMDAKTIAVVGLSDKPERGSYQIAKAMQQAGYKIIPVNPHITASLGEKSYSSVAEVDEEIDIVNVFRRPEYLEGLAQQVIKQNIPVFWAQQGIQNEAAYQVLTSHNIVTVMDLCIKVTHATLIGK